MYYNTMINFKLWWLNINDKTNEQLVKLDTRQIGRKHNKEKTIPICFYY